MYYSIAKRRLSFLPDEYVSTEIGAIIKLTSLPLSVSNLRRIDFDIWWIFTYSWFLPDLLWLRNPVSWYFKFVIIHFSLFIPFFFFCYYFVEHKDFWYYSYFDQMKFIKNNFFKNIVNSSPFLKLRYISNKNIYYKVRC